MKWPITPGRRYRNRLRRKRLEWKRAARLGARLGSFWATPVLIAMRRMRGGMLRRFDEQHKESRPFFSFLSEMAVPSEWPASETRNA